MSIEGQGHFFTLAPGRVHTKIITGFSQKLLCGSVSNFRLVWFDALCPGKPAIFQSCWDGATASRVLPVLEGGGG